LGTRADFYVGRGLDAEWLGSIAWDGYEIPDSIRRAKERGAYRKAVKRFLEGRDDATFPKDGWPWPWEDSATTDYAYAFDGVRTYGSVFGGPWWSAKREPQDEPKGKKAIFPNMKGKMNVQFGGKRSGMLVVTFGADGIAVK
jgi:hypothetical protein